MIVTCGDCRSGDVIHGALRIVAERGVPDESQIHVLLLDGSTKDWPSSQGITTHVVPVHRRAAVRKAFHVGDSGTAFLYDRDLRWRATYHLGQMLPDDLRHDLRVLASS
jgi:hypothetical protein